MKRIIILERRNIPSDLDFDYVMWADVPVARQAFYVNATATSAYKSASAEELAALRDGSVIELRDTLGSIASQTIPQIQAALITRFNRFQADVTNNNYYVRYGTYWDGSAWTSVTVA